MPAHIHPSQLRFTSRTRPIFNGTAYPAQSPGPTKARHVPRAPLPAKGVTSRGVVSRTTSEGITPPSTLIRTHAPDQIPPAGFSCPYYGGSLQVVASPCWEMVLPDVISAILAWVLGPLPRNVLPVHLPVSSRKASASPQSPEARHANNPRNAISTGNGFSELQSFHYVQAPMLARPPDCTHR